VARVVIEHLSKTFERPGGQGIRALDDASFTVEEKEFVVLVGPSGCGKTTTLRLIAGLEEATAGKIFIGDRQMNQVDSKDREVAMVFQDHALYPHMTVYDNLAFGLKVRKMPNAEIARRVREAAELLEIDPCLDRLPGELSGGQRQRVAVGRAMVRQPKVFLFDEPLSNLDVQTRARMRLELAQLHRRLGWTMLYVTHDQVEAMTLADRVVVMEAGSVQQIAKPLEVYRQPENLFVAGFMGSPQMNFIEGVLETDGNGVAFREKRSGSPTPIRELRVPMAKERSATLGGYVGKNIILGIRPEDISLALVPERSLDGPFEAQLDLLQPTGADLLFYLKTATHTVVVRAQCAEQVKMGAMIPFWFEMTRALFFDSGTGKRIGECSSGKGSS
jgi:multiple sugar transport system ATP-binding protein